jgi:hypothetical protein
VNNSKPTIEAQDVDWVEWEATVGLFQAAFWLCHTQWHRKIIKDERIGLLLQQVSSTMWTAWKMLAEGNPEEGTRQLREGTWLLFGLLDADRDAHAADPRNRIALPRFEAVFGVWRCHVAGKAAEVTAPALFQDPWQVIGEIRTNIHQKLVKP